MEMRNERKTFVTEAVLLLIGVLMGMVMVAIFGEFHKISHQTVSGKLLQLMLVPAEMYCAALWLLIVFGVESLCKISPTWLQGLSNLFFRLALGDFSDLVVASPRLNRILGCLASIFVIVGIAASNVAVFYKYRHAVGIEALVAALELFTIVSTSLIFSILRFRVGTLV